MAISEEFIEFLIDQLEEWNEVSYKRMFGGAGLYAANKMFAIIADDVVYMKVDDTNRAMYEAESSQPFKPFDNKPTTMSYYNLPEDFVEDREKFSKWAELSLKIQLKAQPKKKKKVK